MNDALHRGLATRMARLREAEARGDRRIGRGVGFEDPAARRRFGLAGTLAGHLVASRALASGAALALPALEIADHARPADSIEAVLGHDVVHDAVVFGRPGRATSLACRRTSATSP